MDWEKLVIGIIAFVGGLMTSLLKAFIPSYSELYQENRELRETIRGLTDALDDENDHPS